MTTRVCTVCGKSSDGQEVKYCPFCGEKFRAVKKPVIDPAMSPKDAMRRILDKSGRDLLQNDKRRFISLLKDYAFASEMELARIEYALTDHTIKLLYDADKEKSDSSKKVEIVERINNSLVISKGLDRGAALEITSALVYAFNWNIDVVSDERDLGETLNKRSARNESKENRKKSKKTKWKPITLSEMRGLTVRRFDKHSNILFVAYITSYVILFASLAFFVLSFFIWSPAKWWPISVINGVLSIGAGLVVKLLKDSYERCLNYDAMSYFLVVSQNGDTDVIRAVIENFPRM